MRPFLSFLIIFFITFIILLGLLSFSDYILLHNEFGNSPYIKKLYYKIYLSFGKVINLEIRNDSGCYVYKYYGNGFNATWKSKQLEIRNVVWHYISDGKNFYTNITLSNVTIPILSNSTTENDYVMFYINSSKIFTAGISYPIMEGRGSILSSVYIPISNDKYLLAIQSYSIITPSVQSSPIITLYLYEYQGPISLQAIPLNVFIAFSILLSLIISSIVYLINRRRKRWQ